METKRQKIASLWKTCFGDPDEFIQLYFDGKYSDENALLYEENGQAAAALLMLPYPMTWAGTTLHASYISGACTLPEARNKGLMTRLLTEALRTQYRRNTDLSFLIPAEPWLYGYYQKSGYAPVFTHTWETFTPSAIDAAQAATIETPAAYSHTLAHGCYPYFNREMQKRPCCIQHPFDDFSTILQDLYASEGRLLIATAPNVGIPGIAGLAFATPGEEYIYIKELLGESPAVRAQLLHTASRLWPGRTVTCKLPAQPGKSEKGGMARIVHAGNLLARIAAENPQADFSLQLTDALLPENNGTYTLTSGRCIKKKNDDTEACLHLDIAGLAQAFWGGLPGNPAFPPCHPYMSLMID